MKILIADDDGVSRRLLERTLARFEHDVVSVGDGAAALAALQAPDGPELAILDWMMPGLDGLEVCRLLRATTERYIYVIVLTSRDRQEDLVTAFDAEVDDFLRKPVDLVELRARLRSGARLLALQDRLLDAQIDLKFAATHDRLTGLWNRAMIADQLSLAVERARRERSSLAVILADVDHFKQVNDTYGHAVGDAVLKAVASRMQATLRRYDGVGRYGGEEFLIIVQGGDEATAFSIADRLRLAVAASPVQCGNALIEVNLSAGMAWSDAPLSADAMVLTADDALYRAKRAGRNRVHRAVA